MDQDISQDNAIEFSVEESLFVTAPPGYGKTHVLTERIKFIISNGFIKPPQKILVLTFSNAAANEMIKRVSANISQSDNYIDIMNFHTFAYIILRNYGYLVGVSRNFTIIKESDEYEFKRSFFVEQGYINNKYDDYNWIKGYNGWFSQRVLANIEPTIKKSFYDETLFNELKLKINDELITIDKLTFDYLLFKCLDLFKRISES